MPKQPSTPQTQKKPEGENTPAPKPRGVLIKKSTSREKASVSSRPRNASTVSPPATAHLTDGDVQARIAQRAYEFFQGRGGHHGQDLDDWFRAEQEVLENSCEPGC